MYFLRCDLPMLLDAPTGVNPGLGFWIDGQKRQFLRAIAEGERESEPDFANWDQGRCSSVGNAMSSSTCTRWRYSGQVVMEFTGLARVEMVI